MPIKNNKLSFGFTLIELLVVILVIGALSGVLLGVVNSQGVRAKARDSQRKADLHKISLALETYFADHRAYPISNSSNPTWFEQIGASNSTLVSALESEDYISQVPLDPLTSATVVNNPCSSPDVYRYNYKSDGSYYYLTAVMEISSSNDDGACDLGTGADDGICATTVPAVGMEDVCYFVQNP